MKSIVVKSYGISLLLLSLVLCLSSCTRGSSSGSYSDPGYSDETEYTEDGAEYIEDGTCTADVDYYNSATGYSNSYTLDVEVTNGMVTTIYFPNGGYLDEDHIIPSEIDENGDCFITDGISKEYSIHIDF